MEKVCKLICVCWLSSSWRGISLVFLIFILSLLFLPGPLQKAVISLSLNSKRTDPVSSERISEVKKNLEYETEQLERGLERKIPRSYYLVINSSSNVFSLYRGNKLIRNDRCSTGSYILLKNGEEQQWMFKTPKGEFRIQGKTTSPVWKKPDWAFVEEGLPVPSSNHYTRFEAGVLGDYALSLGDGYLIHGTLYQRFLGLPVTHGCIRLGDENLELVYNTMSVGSKVYIF